jgi:hypothetical protein
MMNLVKGIALIILGILCFGVAIAITILDTWNNPAFSFYVLFPISCLFILATIACISFGWLYIDDWKCFRK